MIANRKVATLAKKQRPWWKVGSELTEVKMTSGGRVPKCSKKKQAYTIFCTRPTTCEFCTKMRTCPYIEKCHAWWSFPPNGKNNKSTSMHPAFQQIWHTLIRFVPACKEPSPVFYAQVTSPCRLGQSQVVVWTSISQRTHSLGGRRYGTWRESS